MFKTILFDLDDTLVNTHAVFVKVLNEVQKDISKFAGVKRDEVKEGFKTSLREVFEIYCVSPKHIWDYTLSALQKRYGFSDELKKEYFDHLMHIYVILPTLKEKAIETLEYLEKENFVLGLVTHAEKDWTKFKLEGTGLGKFFKHVEIVDTLRRKSSKDWLNAFNILNTKPEEGMIVGDNKQGDIFAGSEIGAGKLFWVNDSRTWSLYREGDLPENATTISGVSELPSILENLSRDTL